MSKLKIEVYFVANMCERFVFSTYVSTYVFQKKGDNPQKNIVISFFLVWKRAKQGQVSIIKVFNVYGTSIFVSSDANALICYTNILSHKRKTLHVNKHCDIFWQLSQNKLNYQQCVHF